MLIDGVASGGAVATAIRKILDDRRHRIIVGVFGQPDRRRQPDAIRHRNPCGRDLADFSRQGIDDLQIVRRFCLVFSSGGLRIVEGRRLAALFCPLPYCQMLIVASVRIR